jgi:RimJ/RimL family protein N-acetyltransferase
VDRQPTLEGPLVTLRPLRAEDFDALYAVAKDPLIWEQHPQRERCQEETFRGFFREAMASGGALLALDAQSGDAIGSSRFHGYDAARSEVEIGWTFLARSYWGGRYNGEMKQLMLRHALQFVDRVVFLIGPQNLRSQRAVEKIGAVPAGSRVDGTGRTSLVFEITADAFTRRDRRDQEASPSALEVLGSEAARGGGSKGPALLTAVGCPLPAD